MQTVGNLLQSLSRRTVTIVVLFVAAVSLVYPVTPVYAAGTYTITYRNNGAVTTKTYTAGSTITLDPLPSGAIAWGDNNDPSVPGGRMAYVYYDNQIVINRDMALTAEYGSYANGAPGPRLIQFHLELKYYDEDIGAMLEFQQQYNNTNAPSGYYIHLPAEDYFDPITFTTSPAVDVQDPDLQIYKWVYDASYTGNTSITDPSLLHDPSSLIYVDPNNYNQIYNVMVNPSFTITDPGGGTTPVLLPSLLPRHGIVFEVSQKDLPDGGGFSVDGVNYIKDPGTDTSTNAYWQRPVNGLTWENAFSSNPPTSTYDLLPTPQTIPGYTYYWIKDDSAPTLDDVVATGDTLTITASHQYILQYVPNTPFLPVTITADRKTFVWDGQPHSASGYAVTGLDAGDQVIFNPRSLLAATSVTRTDVGSYVLVMSPRDFDIRDSGGNIVGGKYSITVIGGGLAILPTVSYPTVDPVGPPNTGLHTDNSWRYLVALAGGIIALIMVVRILPKRPQSSSSSKHQ